MLTANCVPVNVLPSAGTVIFALPSNSTVLIVLAVCNFVAVNALPDNVAPMNSLADTMLKVLVPLAVVTFPETLPSKLAVIVPAEKSPALSLATILPMTLLELASTLQVVAVETLKFAPVRYVPFDNVFVVLDVMVMSV